MNPQDFDYLRKFLRDRSGLVLSAEKQYLAESRLLPVAHRHGFETPDDLVGELRSHAAASSLGTDVVEAMATNETFFFRDRTPFVNFSEFIIPALIAARAREKRIRIWCAAASTGQEPYSLAMALKELGPAVSGIRIDIVATDLCGDVLERAKAGVYGQFEVQRGLPIHYLLKYFTQVGDMWQIAAGIRAMVSFRTLNLLNDFMPLGAFDIVFCRNVLIYFDQNTKIGVFNRIARQMPDDGYLVLGAAETVVGLTDAFKPLADRRGIYVPNIAMRRSAAAPRFGGLTA